jgi:hypothetical protein
MPDVSVTVPTMSGSTRYIGLSTDIKFPTAVGTGVPRTCQTILQRARQENKNEFRSIYKLDGLKNQFTQLRNNLSDSSITYNATVENQEIFDYLDEVETSQLPTLRLVKNCLAEEQKLDESKLKEAQKAYETSKARFESIDEDHETVGYYESWFPLHRYVKESNLFVLFGISVFLLILSILTFLHLAGIEFKFILPSLQPEFGGSGYSFSIGDYQQYLIGGAVVGVIFTAVGLWRKWF